MNFADIAQLTERIRAYPLARVTAALERQKAMVSDNLERIFTLDPTATTV